MRARDAVVRRCSARPERTLDSANLGYLTSSRLSPRAALISLFISGSFVVHIVRPEAAMETSCSPSGSPDSLAESSSIAGLPRDSPQEKGYDLGSRTLLVLVSRM